MVKRNKFMIKFMLSCVIILSFSCAVPERYVTTLSQEQQKESKLQYLNTPDKTDESGIKFKGGDGSSMENAIIIYGVKNEIEAIPAEIDYISKRHGERDRSWKMIMQSNFKINDRIYVEYQIEDYKKGIKTSYVFDNTSFYSAFMEKTAAPVSPQQVQKDTRPAYQPAGEITESSGIRYKGGDGSSMAKAIIIFGAKNEKEVIQAEIDYISRRHGEKDKLWEIMFKSNFRKSYRHYNEINIKDFKSNERFSYCFDATDAYDK